MQYTKYSMNQHKTISLIPPLITTETIAEKIVCIRAHRERIFQVYSQQLGEKIIFHNYGHGGAGWTFLFGCVPASIRDFERVMQDNPVLRKKPISVIGAGCYGLLTAIMLQRKGYEVSIIARDTVTIPSNKAAGFFFPRARKCSNELERSLFLAYGMESYKTYLSIAHGEHPFIAQGPRIIPAYYGVDIDPGFMPYINADLIKSPKEVTIDFQQGKRYNVMQYDTVFINTAVLMQELWRSIHDLNISVIKREIESFDEVADPIIFNCAGMGAKKLTNDHRIVPVQGHLITLKNQISLERLQYMINVKVVMTDKNGKSRDELIYYAPKHEGILGITFIRGQDSEMANHHEFDRLIERCQSFFGCK